jgi:hypothetical protein
MNVEVCRIQLEYQYSVAFARRATFAFLRRYGRRAFVLAGAALFIGIARVLMQVFDYLTVGLLLLPLVMPLTWAVYIRRAAKLARSLRDRRIIVVIEEQGITFETTERRSFTSWASLKEVWKLASVWLVFPYGTGVGGAYTAIPVDAMTAEARAVISQKLKEHGTIVRG